MDKGSFYKLAVLFSPQDAILFFVSFTCLWCHITTQNTAYPTSKLKFNTAVFPN